MHAYIFETGSKNCDIWINLITANVSGGSTYVKACCCDSGYYLKYIYCELSNMVSDLL